MNLQQKATLIDNAFKIGNLGYGIFNVSETESQNIKLLISLKNKMLAIKGKSFKQTNIYTTNFENNNIITHHTEITTSESDANKQLTKFITLAKNPNYELLYLKSNNIINIFAIDLSNSQKNHTNYQFLMT